MGTKQANKPKAPQNEQERRSNIKQQELLKLFGKIDYDEAYDYKSERKRVLPVKTF